MKRLTYGSAPWRRWLASLPRAAAPRPAVERQAARILRDVERRGDVAVIDWTRRLDGVRLTARGLRLRAEDVRARAFRADRALVKALRAMSERIETYHRRQLASGFRVRLPDGSLLEEIVSPLDSVGLYVPGGAGAYPSTVLMNAIPARVAGVKRIAVTTPPRALDANPAVAAALVIAGLEDAVHPVGGAQAVGALAYGTRTIAPVAKIVGPGNAWVAAAKRLVRGRVEIDQDAGPSEVVVLADETADAGWVAADLLAQAEHGSGDETVVLVTTSGALADEVSRHVLAGQAVVANRKATARALRRQGAMVLVRDLDEGALAVNTLAPEHVQVMTRGAAAVARRLVAGAVFVGPWAPVAVGDYGVGPNHVLPTGGTARHRSPLSVRDFQRTHSRVQLSRRALAHLAPDVVSVAMAEGFPGHAQSVLARLES